MVPPPWLSHNALIKQPEIHMTTTRELCHLLSATLHLPGVDRYAARLVRRGLLPRAGCKVYALDAALLLMAVMAAPRPADAPRVVATLADPAGPRHTAPASIIGAALDLLRGFETDA